MVRNRTENRKIANFDEESMKRAVLNVINNGVSIRSAARNEGLVHMTLKRYVDKYKNVSHADHANLRFKPNYEINKVFSNELEQHLREYLLTACRMHHGLTRKNVMSLAYDLAKKNNLKYPANWDKNQEAGVDWLNGFMKRNPTLAIRKPEATSLGRATSFNRTTVNEFFDNLCRVYSKFPGGPLPQNIYNLDETALTTVHNPPNIIGQKGLKQIGQVTSGERGVLVTACCFINAMGNSIPPYLIFPRVHFKDRMLTGGPPGIAGGAAKSGWVNSVLFIEILKHFHGFVKSTPESPVLLILDNHESHISIDSIEYSKHHGILLLTLPPHTSGKLQPLDKTVYKSLKTNFNSACNDWMVMNPGKAITIYDISGLLGVAYPKAFTPNNITNGFKATGIWPLNRDIFNDDDFLSSAVTDRPHTITQHSPGPSNSQQTPNSPRLSTSEPLPKHLSLQQSPIQSSSQVPTGPKTSQHSPTQKTPEQSPPDLHQPSQQREKTSLHTNEAVVTTKNIVTPVEIRPFPKASPRKQTVQRRRTKKSLILTETPIKDQIIEDLRNKQTVKRNVFKRKGKQTLAKRIKQDSSSETESDSVCVADSSDSVGPMSDDDEEVDMNFEEIAIGDYVLVQEGKSKGHNIMSIGRVLSKFKSDVNVQYVKRLFPTFKFIHTDEKYTFEMTKIIAKLPVPKPSGGTNRRSEMLIFSVDLHIYHNELK